MQQEGKGGESAVPPWCCGSRADCCSWGRNSSRITPRVPPGLRRGAGCWESHQIRVSFPLEWEMFVRQGRIRAGVSARAEEGRKSRLGMPEQERTPGWGGSCSPGFCSWISGRKGKLGIRKGSGRGAGPLQHREVALGVSVRNEEKPALQ